MTGATGGDQVILSINFNHDGSAVLLVGGRIAGFVTTERYSRLKKHPGLREADLDELLDQAGVGIGDVDHVLLCNLHNMDSPDIALLHGSDLKHTWLEFWVNQRQDEVLLRGVRIPCTVNPDHHLIHAATAWFTSPFSSGVVVAIDPTGCRAFLGRDNVLMPLRYDFDAWFNANVGYVDVAATLFGSSILGAGKVMGLAAYGRRPGPEALDGRISSFAQLFALAEKDPVHVQVGERQLNATLAAYVQYGLEQQMIRLFSQLQTICARNGVAPRICLSGGTALNAPATQGAFASSGFEQMYFHPACGDDGTSIGAALWYWHDVLGHARTSHGAAGLMYGVRRYDTAVIDSELARHADRLHVEPAADHADRAAELIAGGAVIGWFDGASEVGPRALGHRSVLADPRDPAMRDRLNSRVKFREHFRPFAPSVLAEHSVEWFGIHDSPFMLRAVPVRRPGVPAVVHVDGLARIQTVEHADNPAFHALISAFAAQTGVPMVLNTSLNTKGEPIVETPRDAIRTLLSCELDHLVFPGLVVSRRGTS